MVEELIGETMEVVKSQLVVVENLMVVGTWMGAKVVAIAMLFHSDPRMSFRFPIKSPPPMYEPFFYFFFSLLAFGSR